MSEPTLDGFEERLKSIMDHALEAEQGCFYSYLSSIHQMVSEYRYTCQEQPPELFEGTHDALNDLSVRG